MHPFIPFQHIKIGKVRQMTQQDHSYIDFSGYSLPVFRLKHHRVLFFYINPLIVRHYSKHRNLAEVFDHLYSGLKQADIPSKLIDNNTPLLIANSDQIVDMNIAEFINDSENRNLDGSVLCFKDHDTKWSYAKIDGEGLITEIREKVVISEFATVGIYYFAKGGFFVKNAIDMIIRNERVKNEFYVAPVYNFGIQEGLKFGIFNININQMHGIGTPTDLNVYIDLVQRNK